MSIKQFLIKAHMILGLTSGIVVFVMGTTGALYAFKSEIEEVTQRYKKVSPEESPMIKPSEALAIAEEANPGIQIHGVVYQETTDAIEVVYYQGDPLYYGASYLNPYSGEVLKTVNYVNTFFGFVLRGHIALWLPLKIGTPIVAISAHIFLIMLITGIILWWPRRNRSSSNFYFSKKASSKTKLLEQHKIIGFYVFWIALLLVLTGMTWVFRGFDKAVYKAMGGEKEVRYKLPESNIAFADSAWFDQEPIDVLYDRIKQANPDMPFIEMHAVHDSLSSILVELNPDPSLYYKMDFLYFDQYSLEPIPSNTVYGSYADADVPDKVKRMYYDIHTGSILRFPGKLLACLASLFCASLPVTGFLLWRQRKKVQKDFLKQMEL